MKRFQLHFRGLFLAHVTMLLLAGCANVRFDPDKPGLDAHALIFGRILLVRDGETSVLNPMGTPITIGSLGANSEPLMMIEPLDENGRFFWKLPPGHYLLETTLRPGEAYSLAFEVPQSSRAYYFGDLIFKGRKQFHALGSANIGEVSATLESSFDLERENLLKRSPYLAGKIDRLMVRDASSDHARQTVLRMELDSTPVCCRSMTEFRYEKLIPGKPKVFEISPLKEAFDFPEGRSHYLALELPSYKSPYSILLRSHMIPTGIPQKARAFYPAALLLDDQFMVIERIKTDLTHPAPATLVPLRSISLDGELDISTKYSRARYLVLYTTDRLLGNTGKSSVPAFIGIAGGALPLGKSRTPVGIEPTITGWIEIELTSP